MSWICNLRHFLKHHVVEAGSSMLSVQTFFMAVICQLLGHIHSTYSKKLQFKQSDNKYAAPVNSANIIY